MKNETEVHAAQEPDERGYEMAEARVPDKYQGTETDRRDMTTLGRIQELRRNFEFVSVMGFGCTLLCSWEVLLTTISIGLTNGGTAGLIWGNIIVAAFIFCVYASIAEMASMAPTSAGQYHWVSEFSPRFCQKFLSYLTGWLCLLGWQTSAVFVSYLVQSIIQGLIILNKPDTYVPERWHGTLLIIAVAMFAIFFNTTLAKKLPLVEGLVLAIHILGMFVIIIPLWVLAPRNNAHDVLTTFSNNGGWSSTGGAFMVGLTTSLLSLLGFDCSVHMSEEIKDASRTLPRAIMAAVSLNAVLGFVTVVSICFCLGDLESVLFTPTFVPFIQVIHNATGNLAATNVLTAVVIIPLAGSIIASVAASSRQSWSFARDNGIPGSRIISKVTDGWNIPLNAVLFQLCTIIVLSLVNIGSTVAMNAILALTASSLLLSYILCISCVLIKRLRGEPLPMRRWSLGRYGAVLNAIAILFLLPMFVLVFFPPVTPVVPETMNWACVMFGFVVIFSTTYYFIHGRNVYVPPVSLVRREM